jgi:acetolactate synthase-1/3 small subunit
MPPAPADTPSHTLVAILHDRPGALTRAVSLFRRRGFNIASLTVARTEIPDHSRMTVVVEHHDVRQVMAQLQRLVDVIAVHEEAAVPDGAAAPSRASSHAA